MALWNQADWNSGILWGPFPAPPAVQTQPRNRHKTMKRQQYFPRTVDGRPEWFGNYATQLPIANVVLTLPAPDVTASVADAKFLEYASGPWLTATREYGPACTAALDQLFNGTGTGAFILPPFTVPALPAGVVAVAAGALTRIFHFVQTIKASPKYTEALGLQLGIVGPEDVPPPAMSGPQFTLTVEQGAGSQIVRVKFKKSGHMGVAIYARRGAGDWVFLGIDTGSPYLDERPLANPAQPEVREYRLRFWDDGAENGDWSDVARVTVAP